MPTSNSSGLIRVLSGPLAGAEFQLDDRILIGRLSECDVHLVDGQVSREHAMIVRQADEVLLVDLESANGTFVGGRQIKKQALRGGDHFRISESTFVFDDGAPPPGPPSVELNDADAPFEERGTREVVRQPSDDGLRAQTATRATVELGAEPAPFPSRATVELEAARQASGTAELYPIPTSEPPRPLEDGSPAPPSAPPGTPPDMPVFLPPPPLASAANPGESKLAYTEVEASFSAGRRSAVTRVAQSDYEGNLLDDISTYRSFRLRLQRDEMPGGEEVAAMIDLEARLRNPTSEGNVKRDVVAQRFFRRFMFDGPMTVRIQLARRTVHLEGRTEDLSVDGLRCTLDLAPYTPKRDQFAVLILEGPRADRLVQFMFTSRVVWVKQSEVGFVFAGAPSWKERSATVEDAKTDAVRRPSEGDAV